MRKFDRAERFGRRDRRSDDRDEGRGRRSSGPLEMHKATCAKCGERCEVPFRPSGDKPVYCRDCFKKNDSDGGRQERPGRGRSERGGDSSELRDINRKLDMIMEALEIQ
jgi:CxxC-x17-CxxC domain-containing protein